MKKIVLLSSVLLIVACHKSEFSTEINAQSYQDLQIIVVDTLQINTPQGIAELFSIEEGENLVFHYHEDNQDEIEGSNCVDCLTSLDLYFQIPPNLEEFHISDESLLETNAHYQNLFGIGLFKGRASVGEIHGKKISVNAWDIEFNLQLGFSNYENRTATYFLD